MDPTIQDHMRRQLLAKRARLVKIDSEHIEDLRELREGGDVDLEDHAQTLTAQDGVVRLDDRERSETGELDAALGRLAEGSYGLCERCGKAIQTLRLEALPEARTCAACSSLEAAKDR